MPGRPDESMTRTKSPYEGSGSPRGIPPARRFAFLALLVVLVGIVALSLGWAAFSPNGNGAREVQAQTSGDSDGTSSESPEIAQSQTSQSDDQGSGRGSGDPGQEDYAAYGEKGNPFNAVVPIAESEDSGGGNVNSDNGGSNDGGSGSGSGNVGGGGDDGSFSDDTSDVDDDLSQDTGSSGNGATENGTITGPNGEQIDCSSSNTEFEQVICEDEFQGEDFDGGSDTLDDQQSNGEGDLGSGGSGRSGSQDTADEFRNGGGGIGK